MRVRIIGKYKDNSVYRTDINNIFSPIVNILVDFDKKRIDFKTIEGDGWRQDLKKIDRIKIENKYNGS